jgi:membrane-bound lytic murein transglycosylase D
VVRGSRRRTTSLALLTFSALFAVQDISAEELPAPVLPPGAFSASALAAAAYPLPGPVSPEGRPLRSWPRSEEAPPPPFPADGPYAGTGAILPIISGPVIPGLDRPLTERYITQYSSPAGLRWLAGIMKDAAPWLFFIREEIAKRDLPPELLYLPVIESAFNPTALSTSGAAGLWQFMRNSIAPFDMRITSWVDERLDFWKSTQGALRKLEENYRELQDWPLALAAYNMGLGGLRRVMRQSGQSDYWELSARNLIKTENIHYVPKFLAVAHILSNPRRFGMDLDWSEDPGWTRIKAGRHVDLDKLAGEAGIDAEMLRRANAECLHGITPAESWYSIKVSAADADAVEEILARETGANPVFPRIHTVAKGETLWGIGRQYRVTPEDLAAANNMGVNDVLREGRTLNIPIME